MHEVTKGALPVVVPTSYVHWYDSMPDPLKVLGGIAIALQCIFTAVQIWKALSTRKGGKNVDQSAD